MDGVDDSTLSQGAESTSAQLQRGTDLYSQLEVMMGAVRNESAQLAAAKEQVAELEKKNKDIPKLAAMLQLEQEQNALNGRRLGEADTMVSQLRGDMQRLNDIYSKERKLRSDIEQQKQRVSNDLNLANQNLKAVSEDMVRVREAMEAQKKEMQETAYKFSLEKNELIRNLAHVKTELDESEKAKKEVSLHFWNIKQDTQRLQETLMGMVQENSDLKSQIDNSTSRSLRDQESLLMVSEDQRAEIARLHERSAQSTATVKGLQNETRQLYQALSIQESQTARLSKELAGISGDTKSKVEKYEAENSRLSRLLEGERGAAAAHAEQIEALKERAAAASKLQIVNKSLETDNERLKSSLKSKEESLVTVETSLSQLMASREQELLSSESNGSFIEQLEAQLKDANEQKWAAEREASEQKKSLSDELASTQRALEETSERVESMKNEKIRYEEFMKQEIQNAGKLGTVLKNELELRLEELSQTRKERDTLAGEASKLTAKVEELTITIGRSDAQFREVLEADRAKIQQDLRIKSNRCRALEAEKQELLSETSTLMKQVHDQQVKRDSAIAQMEKSAQLLTKAETEIDSLETVVSDLKKELKAAQRREKQLHDDYSLKEQEFRQEVSKLDSVIKSSSKSATSQVAEMSEKMRILSSTNEEQKLRIASLEATEKKSAMDADRRAEEMRILNERHDASLNQLTVELSTVRRDLSETRQRFKLNQDDNLKKEREIMSLQTDANKLEAEIHRYRDRLRDAEDRGISVGEQIAGCRCEIDNLATELRRAKASLADQDQVLITKSRAVERAERDLKALEQEGFIETKKLRAKLKETIGELDALRSTELPRLRKELEEASSSHNKLQTSNSATINGLITEVNATEDALSNERRSRESESSQYQSQIKELQISLEKANEIIAEHATKASANTSEKSARFMFLEGEVERLKMVLTQRDERISELEKQQQSGRVAMQGFRDTQANLENSLSDARRSLETEASMRRSLEETVKRLQRQTSQAAHDAQPDNESDGGESDDMMPSGMSRYASRPSEHPDPRAMSPIDVFTGGGGDDSEDDGYTRGTAMSSLSGSGPSSLYASPYASKGAPIDVRESPLSVSEVRRFAGREVSNPELRMSPVEEHRYPAKGSPNNRNTDRITDTHDSVPSRIQKSVKFNRLAEDEVEETRYSPEYGVANNNDNDAGSVASVDEEAQDSINRTQIYLQQRLMNKHNNGKNKSGQRFSSERNSVPMYATAHTASSDDAPADRYEGTYIHDDPMEAGVDQDEIDDEEDPYVAHSNVDYETDTAQKPSVSRRKKASAQKKPKKKKPQRIEFVGEPGNFHIQAVGGASMQTSASADNIKFPRISSGRK